MKSFFDRLASLTFAPFRLDEWAVLLALVVVVVGAGVWVIAEWMDIRRGR